MSNSTTKNNAPLVSIPDATLPATIKEWRSVAAWMDTAKKQEKELRTKIANAFFPTPTEGVNRVLVDLDGVRTEIAMDFRINRKLDETVLDSVMLQLPEDSPYRQQGVLVAYEPKLVLKSLRTMPDDQRRIFSQALTETPGTPALDINEITEGHAPETSPAVPDWPAQNIPVQTVTNGLPSGSYEMKFVDGSQITGGTAEVISGPHKGKKIKIPAITLPVQKIPTREKSKPKPKSAVGKAIAAVKNGPKKKKR